MKLDARNGDINWMVWDVKRCARPKRVVWVDDETARWGQYTGRLIGRETLEQVEHQEERITIYANRRLILFNEVEDGAQDDRGIEEFIRDDMRRAAAKYWEKQLT